MLHIMPTGWSKSAGQGPDEQSPAAVELGDDNVGLIAHRTRLPDMFIPNAHIGGLPLR